MSLIKGNSPRTIRANIKKLHGEGKTHAQAVSKALDIAKKSKKKAGK
ncbi:MAG: hypothetical protein P4L50_03355 [Anaerolineaceae bacterium]|nr:hypothetical protein [Anaerolineaceae bacterium]